MSPVVALGITHTVVQQALCARQASHCFDSGSRPIFGRVMARPRSVRGVVERLAAVHAGKRHRTGGGRGSLAFKASHVFNRHVWQHGQPLGDGSWAEGRLAALAVVDASGTG